MEYKCRNAAAMKEPFRFRYFQIGMTITKNANVSGGYEISLFPFAAEAGKNKEQGHSLTLVFKKK
jgi:hypothetical protein